MANLKVIRSYIETTSPKLYLAKYRLDLAKYRLDLAKYNLSEVV